MNKTVVQHDQAWWHKSLYGWVFLYLQENVISEAACQTLCHDTDNCEWYTWFDQTNKVFYNYCFLFKSCNKVSVKDSPHLYQLVSDSLQVSCNCIGCSSGPSSCSPAIGEIVPSAAPAPSLVTIDNLEVASSLLPPLLDQSLNEIADSSFSSGMEKLWYEFHTIVKLIG